MSFRLELVAGSTRSGKTYLTAERVKREPRLLVWDAMGEFAASFRCRKVTSRDELATIAARGIEGRFAYVAPVTAEQFDFWCRSAWLWLRVMAHHGRRVALVVEELADVTPPGKAPPAWGEIIRKSMRFDPYVIGLTQAPAESDKTIVRNATVLRCHTMQRAADRRAMAAELDVDPAVVDGLDMARYQYVERDRRTGELVIAGKGQKPRPIGAAGQNLRN